MSSQALYEKAESEVNREARRKAFKRKRRRKKRIRALCLLAFFAIIVIALVIGVIKGIGLLYDRHIEKTKYVDYDEHSNLILIDNVLYSEKENEAFFDIDENDDKKEEVDRRRLKYEGIVPGSKGLVIVDAGHGGFDGGAEENGVTEKDINLEISLKLRDELVLRGYSVYLTRPDDEFVGLVERASLANALDNPLCLVSVHQNSVDDYESIAGIEAWTYDRAGCTELGNALCEAAARATGAQNRGTNYRTNLVVTSKTTMPAVIIECGFISNEKEAELLSTDEYQEKLSIGITDGIEKFVSEYYR